MCLLSNIVTNFSMISSTVIISLWTYFLYGCILISHAGQMKVTNRWNNRNNMAPTLDTVPMTTRDNSPKMTVIST